MRRGFSDFLLVVLRNEESERDAHKHTQRQGDATLDEEERRRRHVQAPGEREKAATCSSNCEKLRKGKSERGMRIGKKRRGKRIHRSTRRKTQFYYLKERCASDQRLLLFCVFAPC